MCAVVMFGEVNFLAGAEEIRLGEALQSNGLSVSIHGGRVVFEGDRVVNTQLNLGGDNSAAGELVIRNESGEPTVNYKRNNAKEKIYLDVVAGDRIEMRRIPQGKSDLMPVEFVQIPHGKITLTLGAAGHQQVFNAAGLWHLWIAHPQECQKYLVPLLEMLRPDWRLSEMESKVEERLLQGMDEETANQRARWAKLVEQLGDDRFAKREAADRMLRAADPSVLNFLRQLDFHRLDAEQQFRVRRIIESLAGPITDDSPEDVATLLGGDSTVWLALLGRPEVGTRRIAAKQLASLLNEPLSIDPEADPATQASRRTQLQSSLEEK
jgi:hypothetical protein